MTAPDTPERIAARAIRELMRVQPVEATIAGKGFYGVAVLARLPIADGLPRYAIVKYMRDALCLAEERQALARMRAHCPTLPLPRIYGATADGHATVMEYMPGEDADRIVFDDGALRDNAADEIAECLLTLHAARPTDGRYGTDDKRYDRWIDCYRDRALDMMSNIDKSHALQRLSHENFRVFVRALDAIGDILSCPPAHPSLLHGDYNLCNLRVDPRTGRVSGVLDPMHSIWGDREADLFQLRQSGGAAWELLDRYRDRYGLSADFAAKDAMYAAFAEADHYGRCNMPQDEHLQSMIDALDAAL